MKSEYVVTNEYLTTKGLDLNDYALDGTLIPAIINIALDDILITRICYLDDDIKGEGDVEKYLDEHPEKVPDFLVAQYRAIYSLIFQAEESPIDTFLDNVIVFRLGLGKINGFQKGLYYRHDR